MAQATVKTVQYIDPRIEPQPDPVYDYVIAPTQSQYYKIPASGLSQTSVNFNNLTTLGIDRAYLDNMEIEITASINFDFEKFPYMSRPNGDYPRIEPKYADGPGADESDFMAMPHDSNLLFHSDAPITTTNVNEVLDRSVVDLSGFTFDSFPFHKCCSEARANVNGGSFFSQPAQYLRAKERYMDQYELMKSYQNTTPTRRAETQYEGSASNQSLLDSCYDSKYGLLTAPSSYTSRLPYFRGTSKDAYAQFGDVSSSNNSIIDLGGDDGGNFFNNFRYTAISIKRKKDDSGPYYVQGGTMTLTVTWREPVMVSPFSSKYDATYGRPLYNVTSMDIAYQLNDLKNMVRYKNISHAVLGRATQGEEGTEFVYPTDKESLATLPSTGLIKQILGQATLLSEDIPGTMMPYYIKDIRVRLNAASLCYQVMTIPPLINKPLTTLVPYRRFVPYITNYARTMGGDVDQAPFSDTEGANLIGNALTFNSGVYTMNEIPTAIWIFVAPTKALTENISNSNYYGYGLFDKDKESEGEKRNHIYANMPAYFAANSNWNNNLGFAQIEKVNCSLANTTQILATADALDLYRIAKANGCQDSYEQWHGMHTMSFNTTDIAVKNGNMFEYDAYTDVEESFAGIGSVLRLKPGVDLIIPDQPLIPGANANNMVFQAHVDVRIPPHSPNQNDYALWLLFEYVGVAAISPGQCEVTMNPLGSGEIMAVSPVMSATSDLTEGKLEGSGFWDKVKRAARIAGRVADDKMISTMLKRIPGLPDRVVRKEENHGYSDAPPAKRARGGAVIGRGLNEWT